MTGFVVQSHIYMVIYNTSSYFTFRTERFSYFECLFPMVLITSVGGNALQIMRVPQLLLFSSNYKVTHYFLIYKEIPELL